MACACQSKKSGTARTYLVTFTDGTKKAYSSETEAKAAIARKGGGSYKIS